MASLIRTAGESFLLLNGTYYMHDPRIPLYDNTLEHVRSSGDVGDDLTSTTTTLQAASSSGAARLGYCANVPKTFLNQDYCTPSRACSPITYRAANVVLNHTTLRALHEGTGAYVYAVAGLRLVGSSFASASPCVGSSRWIRLNGACGALETALSTATKATLAQAIRASPDAPNPYVRDAIANTVVGGSCETTSTSGVSAIGAKVDVDGACWEHSHPLSLNVYEMNEWAVDHPGNAQYAPDER